MNGNYEPTGGRELWVAGDNGGTARGGGGCFRIRNNTDLLPTHTAPVVAHRIRRQRKRERAITL